LVRPPETRAGEAKVGIAGGIGDRNGRVIVQRQQMMKMPEQPMAILPKVLCLRKMRLMGFMGFWEENCRKRKAETMQPNATKSRKSAIIET